MPRKLRQSWEFIQEPAADDTGITVWHWKHRRPDRVVVHSVAGFRTFRECLKDARANGFGIEDDER